MSQELVRARFKILEPKQNPPPEIEVHFNPTSLQYEVQNQMQQRGGGAQQYVKQSTGKLTMELLYDTTHDGTDVRALTVKVASLMKPKQDKVPPLVAFDWGAYYFEGTVQSYKETLDFFSANGVPLRASLNLTLAAKPKTEFSGGDKGITATVSGKLRGSAVEVPSYDPRPDDPPGPSGAGSPQDAASRAGNPGAARALAAANGAESVRFPTGGSLAVPDEFPLGPPAAFATGGAGLSAGAGAGFGIGGGAGIGLSAGASAGIGLGASASASASAGFGASASAGFGASAGASAGFGASASAGFGASAGASAGFGASASAGFGASAGASAGFGASAGYSAGAFAGFSAKAGGSASAGVSASQGAFAGLSVGKRTSSTARFEVSRLLPSPESARVAAGAGASFAVGGKALVEGNASLRADVGAGASAKAKLVFDEG
jgi:contractile injection system tube protein